MADCNPSSTNGRDGDRTDVGTSKFYKDYTCSLGGVDTVIPFIVDDDQSLPHLVPEVSDVSALDYLALKSSILATQTAIAGTDGVDLASLVAQMGSFGTPFTSVAGAMVHFNTDLFVPLSGNLDSPMTGPLMLGQSQKTAWGQYCETYAVFVDVDSRVSLNIPLVGNAVAPFVNDAVGTPYVIPLAIVGHDATPLYSGTSNRRVKIFDDLDVVEDIRAGRDVIGVNAYFDNLLIGGKDIEDAFVHTVGDDMTGSLNMTMGSSLVIDNASGKVSLSTLDIQSSPVLEFAESSGTWSVNSRVGNLYMDQNGVNDVNVVVRNTGSALANMAVEGVYRGLMPGGNGFSDSSLDLSSAGQAVIASSPSYGSYYGPTASANRYVLDVSNSNRYFNGSQDLIQHFNNVNAHHEETHGLESHVVYDSASLSYRSLILPQDIHQSFGEMLEALVNHGNADLYHTHGGSYVRWGNLQFSNTNSTTITEYLETNYCRKPCGTGSGDSIYWGTLEQYGGGPTIEAWINSNICSILGTQGCSGGGVVRWGALGKSDEQPTLTIEDDIHTWAIATFCPKSGGCGGSGNVVVNNLGTGIPVYYGAVGATTSSLSFKSVAAVAGSGLAVTEPTSGTIKIGYEGGNGTVFKGATFVYSDSAVYSGVSSEETRSLKNSSGATLTVASVMAGMGIPVGYTAANFKWSVSGGVSGMSSGYDIYSIPMTLWRGRPYDAGVAGSPIFKVALAAVNGPNLSATIEVGYMITATKI